MRNLIAANWKMNKTVAESVSFAKELKTHFCEENSVDILVCPPFTCLDAVSKEFNGTAIKLGAQNMHYEDSGAFTGDISPTMIQAIGCEYVILGHSERREFFKEDDFLINKKVMAAIKHGLKPILCIGEILEERDKGNTTKVLETQLKNGLNGVDLHAMEHITIAYEPVWAISRGNPNHKPATIEDAEHGHKFIRGMLKTMFNEHVAKNTRILYGGSMKPDNAKALLAKDDINGGLIGNASLDPKNFGEIIKAAK